MADWPTYESLGEGAIKFSTDTGSVSLRLWPAELLEGDSTTCRDLSFHHLERCARMVELPCQLSIDESLSAEERARLDEGVACRAALNQMPRVVRDILRMYPNHHWEMNSFLSKGGHPALQLAMQERFLALAVALEAQRARHEGRDIKALLMKDRRELLHFCRFPKDKWVWKGLFRKADRAVLQRSYVGKLRRALKAFSERSCKLLKHVPRLNALVINAVSDPLVLSYISPKLLGELSTREAEELNLLGDIGSIARLRQSIMLSLRFFSGWPRGITDLTTMYAYHECLVEHLRFEELKADEGAVFPEPPIVGIPGLIEPITTPGTLVSESRAMHHCAADMVLDVLDGQLYFYHYEKGNQRATIAVQYRAGSWELDDIRGPCNKQLERQVWEEVIEWGHFATKEELGPIAPQEEPMRGGVEREPVQLSLDDLVGWLPPELMPPLELSCKVERDALLVQTKVEKTERSAHMD